ncbi:MAG: YfaZ family outer membrane protein [Pseudomonadota bacterium]|nr:YfaZ family outer membrane protein [Pseudomonadota bacterium]
MKTPFNFKIALLSAGLVMAGSVQANPIGLDLAVSDETANFGAFSQTETPVDLTRYAAHYFYNEPGDRLYSASMQVQRKGMAGDPNLELGVKGKGFMFTQDSYDADGFGLMLGVTGRYWLPTQSPTSIGFEFMHAPEIVTSGDAQSATEMTARADIQILPTVSGFVGVRYLALDLEEKSNYEMDKNLHIGVEVMID